MVEHKNINGFVQNLLKFANIDIQTRLNLKAHSQIREQYNAISALKHANKLYEHKKILVITMMIRDSEERK